MTGIMRRIPLRLWLVTVVLASWALAEFGGVQGVNTSPVYAYATSALLALGLFASTTGIDLAEAGRQRRIILSAITVGVVLKAALIAGVLVLATRDPLFIVLAVAVAQIDPLSVGSIMRDDRLSPKAKSILGSWASFDDPITVILAVYASNIVRQIASDATAAGPGLDPFASSLAATATRHGGVGYLADLALNLALAGLAFAAWRLLRHRPRALGIALLVLFALAVWQSLMLGVAIAGLFVRPRWLLRLAAPVTNGALLAAGALLGLLLVGGVSLTAGFFLGLLAFLAQVVVALLLTRGLTATDRLHLALAQQNGITAIILALRLEVTFAGAVAIIAPAILVTNLTHYVVNAVADRRRPVRVEPG